MAAGRPGGRHAGSRRGRPGPRIGRRPGRRRRCRASLGARDRATDGRCGAAASRSAREGSRWPRNGSRGTRWRRRWNRSTQRVAAGGARMLNDITPLILTFNEAPNIERTLVATGVGARRRDCRQHEHRSHARDGAARHPGVRWFERAFTTHAEQWNFGLDADGDHDRVGAGARRGLRAVRRARRGTEAAAARRRRQRLRSVVHLLHRRPAAARRRVSAGHGVVSSRARTVRAGRPYAARAGRRRR